MNINTTNTQAAFLKYMSEGKEIDYLTEKVHEYVLNSGWIETNEKAILKAIKSITDKDNEMLVDTFAGKLWARLPKLHMGIKLDKHDTARIQVYAGAVITQILIDSGELIVDKRVEPVTTDGNKVFHTRLYFHLGGSHTKDLFKGIESKPGVFYQKEVNGWKLNVPEKAFLRKVATVPFVVSDYCTDELLQKGYSLKEDWDKVVDKNGRPVQEDHICKVRRYRAYSKAILTEVGAMPAFYLPMKYCGRNRMYYEACKLDGMRPQGKLWETLNIDAAVPFDLTEEDEQVLKHLIYMSLYDKKVTLNEANEMFDIGDLLEAQAVDPMDQDNEEDFGRAMLLNKAAKALEQYAAGEPSQYMFGYDFTNSGLLMAGVAFNSPEMMMAANIGGSTSIYDSHTEFGNGYGLDLTRKEIKKVHMPLMHGSALKTIAKVLNEVLAADGGASLEFTEEDIAERNFRAYGACARNITDIAEWGTKVVGNEQSVLRWTMPDGFSAASRAYIKSLPIECYTISASHKAGYTSHVIVADMPWVEDQKGYPIYGNEITIKGNVYKVESKKRGLFAGITHSADAFMLRTIGTAVIDSGRPILFKHDDFMTSPSGYFVVREQAQDTFNEMLHVNFYQEAINDIADNSPYNLEPLELVVGNAYNTVYDSENFLMP